MGDMSRDHRKLEAFKLADSLIVDLYRVTRGFPVEERYGLQAQIRRAGVSVPTNIVEGSARTSGEEYARFLEIALGSAREVAYLLEVAARLDFLTLSAAEPLIKKYSRVQAMLHGVIAAVRPKR
jgi:four helix bundle protein